MNGHFNESTKTLEAIKTILQFIEGEPLRPELEETPMRVLSSYLEMFEGYGTDIDDIFKTFDGEGKDEIVALRDIKSWSFCEHHFLPFSVVAHVAYLPDKCVIGASKLERLVHLYSHRLQLQERITQQVADTLMQKLKPRGVAVILQGEHLCMKCRGV